VPTYFQINEWLEGLMNERSEDLYRTKGVLSIHGWDERFVFQVDIQAIKCFSVNVLKYLVLCYTVRQTWNAIVDHTIINGL
jgi:hypothetical protein